LRKLFCGVVHVFQPFGKVAQMHRAWWVAAVLLSACGSPSRARTSDAVAPSSIESQRWAARLDREHPLVGKIWDVKGARFIDEATLITRLHAVQFVLLGERHDNPDHHRLQARIIEQLVNAGRRPAVVLEMLEPDQQALLESYRARAGATASGAGSAIGWEKTGWPPFAEYRPIFDEAFAARLPIFAGNLAQADVKALVKQGPQAFSAERLRELHLDSPFPAEAEADLVDELRTSHCGQLPEALLAGMALAQHARDAALSRALAHVAGQNGAVLIAGGGHVRRDRAVPRYLALDAPGSSAASVSLREVQRGETNPTRYAEDEGPFDYLWFTPRTSDDDPCAHFGRK